MREIIIDPTQKRKPKDNFIVIDSERKFLENFDTECDIWIKGERLGNWALRFFDNRGIEFKYFMPPIELIKHQLKIIPTDFGDELISEITEIIEDSPEQKHTISSLLKTLTKDDIWSQKVNWEHLAEFLFRDPPDYLMPLIKHQVLFWQGSSPDPELGDLYMRWFNNKDELIREWLGMTDKVPNWKKSAPLNKSIPKNWMEKYIEYWEKAIIESEGSVILDIRKEEHFDIAIIARTAFKYFSTRKDRYKKDYLPIINPYLPSKERDFLRSLETLEDYTSFPYEKDGKSVLDWGISYLKHKKIGLFYQLKDEQFYLGEAKEFGKWYLENYLLFKNTPIEKAFTNLRVSKIISDLLKSNYVFWIIVDGLGFLEHEYLIRSICQREDILTVNTGPLPLLSVVPSITEIAKWSLITGKYFNESSSDKQSLRDAFAQNWKDSFYANESNINSLRDRLVKGEDRLYCIDIIELDKKFHDNVNYQYMCESVTAQLDSIAANVLELYKLWKKPDELVLVISGDHGQIMGYSPVIKKPEEQTKIAGGRVIFEEPETNAKLIHLKANEFGLKRDCWILESNETFGALKSENNNAVGVHGGIFPEELIVGCSILRTNVEYKKLEIEISGSGLHLTGGEICIKIMNRNEIPLENLRIIIDELPSGHNQFFMNEMLPFGSAEKKFSIPEWPNPENAKAIGIKGCCEYNFIGGQTNRQTISGTLQCGSIYEQPRLLDEW